MKGSYADQVDAARLLLGGLKNHREALARRGLDDGFADRYAALLAEAQRLDAEQEGLKAALASKTAQLYGTLDELSRASSEVKKLVKLDFPQTGWKEFGISDSR
jgi:hypothetical protein